jgi:hypothetical protein
MKEKRPFIVGTAAIPCSIVAAAIIEAIYYYRLANSFSSPFLYFQAVLYLTVTEISVEN